MAENPTRSITIRLDEELFLAAKEAARNNDRSMNAEISARLASSLSQDALWHRDPMWPMRDKLDRERISHEEQVQNLRTALEFVTSEWDGLSDGLAGLPNSVKSAVIRRLSELEGEKSRLESKLRLIDPHFRNGL